MQEVTDSVIHDHVDRMIEETRVRAEAEGVPFELDTPELRADPFRQLKEGGRCEITGRQFDLSPPTNGSVNPDTPTLGKDHSNGEAEDEGESDGIIEAHVKRMIEIARFKAEAEGAEFFFGTEWHHRHAVRVLESERKETGRDFGPDFPQTEITTFRFRGEFYHDADSAHLAILATGRLLSFKTDMMFKSDPLCTVEIFGTLENMLAALWTIPDGHVMWETVQPIEEYTGERTYGQDEAREPPIEPEYPDTPTA